MFHGSEASPNLSLRGNCLRLSCRIRRKTTNHSYRKLKSRIRSLERSMLGERPIWLAYHRSNFAVHFGSKKLRMDRRNRSKLVRSSLELVRKLVHKSVHKSVHRSVHRSVHMQERRLVHSSYRKLMHNHDQRTGGLASDLHAIHSMELGRSTRLLLHNRMLVQHCNNHG